MCTIPGADRAASGEDARAPLRHRRVPERRFGSKLIVARPSDGAPVVLGALATRVWRLLDDWTSPDAVQKELVRAFPEVRAQERLEAGFEIIDRLRDDDLLE